MAIPWLHVLREHPSFLKDYEGLFLPSNILGNLVNAVVIKTRNNVGWLRQLWRALWSNGEPWSASKELLTRVDVLLVSHLLNDADAGKTDDFYFGNLPETLGAGGHRIVVALIDHTVTPDPLRVQRWDRNLSPRILLSRMLDFQGELSLHRRLRRESSRLALLSRQEANGLLKKVFARASLEAMSGGARATLRMSEQISRLVEMIRPRIIMVTYEGHAWERVAFSAARKATAGVQCVGFQHAAIFRLQHAALRELGPALDPDLILTAGSVSKRQIEVAMKAQVIPVRVLGSNRAFMGPKSGEVNSSSIRDEFDTRSAAIAGHACLVIPEGIVSECLLLFEFSLSCAELMPNVRFIWRLHPLITPASIVKANPRLRLLPANVEFSQMGLEEDFRRASYVLYRGSTAVIKAASFGLRPIYLANAGEMSIDPLYELGALIDKVSRPDEFQAVICAEEKTVLNTTSNQKAIAGYCDAFYSRLEPAAVLSMLS